MPLFQPQMERLGSIKLGSAAVTTGALAIPARDFLFVICRITGYTGNDIASLRFNADSTIANYTSSFVTATNATAPPVLARINNAASLGHIPIGSAAIVLGRTSIISISNLATTRKVCKINSSDEQSSSAAATIDIAGYGEWLNTAAQITSIEMRTSGGSNSMNAGSGFAVFGGNF